MLYMGKKGRELSHTIMKRGASYAMITQNKPKCQSLNQYIDKESFHMKTNLSLNLLNAMSQTNEEVWRLKV